MSFQVSPILALCTATTLTLRQVIHLHTRGQSRLVSAVVLLLQRQYGCTKKMVLSPRLSVLSQVVLLFVSYYSQTDPYNVFAGLVGAVVLTYPGNLVEKVRQRWLALQ